MSQRRVGSYELLERIGEGGMGEVWLARHESLRRFVAVKLIHPQTLSSGNAGEARRRFEREAHATSALRSPHTVALYDYGTTAEGDVFYAMELLEGVSLATLVTEFGPVPPERAVHLLGGICESLAEAHGHGIVHRDVKPGNVFTCVLGTKYDFVKVLDFGLARTLPGLDSHASPAITTNIAGSPAFMAPEAARGEIAPSCDIYALGCVAYWLLTGKFVFQAPTPIDVILAHLQRDPAPPSAHGVAVPRELDGLVLSCLAKEPRARPSSVAEIADRLDACPLDERWTAARARRFFDENRDLLARVTPAAVHTREVAEQELVEEPRRASLDRLQHHFTRSHIDVHELEIRMLRVKKAASAAEIDRVFADLPPLEPVVTAPIRPVTPPIALPLVEVVSAPSVAIEARGRAPVEATVETKRRSAMVLGSSVPQPLAKHVVSVMSSNRRDLSLVDGEIATAVAVMGEATILVDGSQIGDGFAELKCVAVMGSLTILVRPGIEVESAGVGILGAFERVGGGHRKRSRPQLRVTGVSVLGSVELVVGEDAEA